MLLHLDIITNIVAIIIAVIYLRPRFNKPSATTPVAADNKSAIGKYGTALAHIEKARAKHDALKTKVERFVSDESQVLRDDIYHLHAQLDAEIIYAESHHALLG